MDVSHAKLLLMLIERPYVSSQDFRAEAGALGLLPEGAIETLNDWGFEVFDDIILNDNNGISVEEVYRSELKKMVKA